MVREEEDALAGGVAAPRRLERQQRLARPRRSVEDDARRAPHVVQRLELLLRAVEDLLVNALRASLRALEELGVGAQSLDDLVAVLGRGLTRGLVEPGHAQLGGAPARLLHD